MTPQQPNTGMHIPNTSSIRRKTEDVLLARKETGCSPKWNKLKRLLNPTNADERAASKQFKNCIGRPVMHVNENDGGPRGSGAEGTCIVCNKTMNWYCVDCGNWCCHHRSQPDGVGYFRDINTYHGSNGSSHHITGKVTYLMSCHPKYLCSCSIAENGEGD